MIYTVTFNPAVDYIVRVGALRPGEVNRSDAEDVFFGGKGINVSLVLKQLGIESHALGFIAGFTGTAIEDGIRKAGITTDFVRLQSGFSRINVKIKSSCETELNGQGPQIPQDSIRCLLEKLGRLQRGDVLILAGSIPNTLPENMYEKIMEPLAEKGIDFVVDATGELLVNVLPYKPFLIKPNKAELSEIFKKPLHTDAEIVQCARALQQRGAKNVLVSLAGDGALLADEHGKIHKMAAAQGTVINSVGAGDSMVAGFLAGYICKKDYAYALRLGTAAGGATAFSPGLAEKQEIDRLLCAMQSV